MRTILLILSIAAAMAPAAAMAVPLQLAHQGELADADGPVTATLLFTFELFDVETEGVAVWSEERSIDVVGGHYSVLLGGPDQSNPIEEVLLQEPSLFLQITIDGGDPLLPRQPVASVPYAIVAETAVNVDGGTVNASEISINNNAVIDASGTWVSGAGSISWAAIDGAPGDEDTLGGLSCADGDRAMWSDGLGLWECSSATVELDRLDVAGATGGQVLSYDGADVVWAEPGATGDPPCTLVELNESLSYAQVTCGATDMVIRTWKQFEQLSAGQSHTCGIDTAGEVACWGIPSNGQTVPPPGTFSEVASGWTHTCAINSGGLAECWGSDTHGQATPSGGTFAKLSAATYFTCGITTADEIECWGIDDASGSDFGQVTAAPTSGTFSEVSAGWGHACAIESPSGSVQCWGYDSNGQATPPVGSFTKVAAGHQHTCALDGAGAVECWGISDGSPDDSGQVTSAPTSGVYEDLAAGHEHTCARATDGSVTCWGEGVAGHTTPPAATYAAVTAGKQFSCGILQATSTVTCWGTDMNGQGSPP